MATVKANSDNTLSLHSCDPGEAAKVVTNKQRRRLPAAPVPRQLIAEFVKEGATPHIATCVGRRGDRPGHHPHLVAGRPATCLLTNPTALGGPSIANCDARDRGSTVVPPDQIDK